MLQLCLCAPSLLSLALMDPDRLPSPCYVVDLEKLEANARLLAEVRQRAGCRILLALKGFAMWGTFPLLRKYLDGTTASGLHEALLGQQEFGGEVHVYAAAFKAPEIDQLATLADHIVFNTPAQWLQFRDSVRASGRPLACGLRVNPEHSTGKVPLYDPAGPGSRLGTTAAELKKAETAHPDLFDGLSGLHFHTLCEQNSDDLATTLAAFEERFAPWLPRLRWVNFGGGHHITRPDYDVDLLIRLIKEFRQRHRNVETIYLEPGEAVALQTGYLVATVLDFVPNGDVTNAILDTSATCHMPDTLEMPYRAEILGAGQPGEHPHTYRLGGMSCLAGDIIGDYSFPEPLAIGQRLVFTDMAHYTMVKNTTFNGVPLPAIATYNPAADEYTVLRRFDYDDYRRRLG